MLNLDALTTPQMRARLGQRFDADPIYRVLHYLLGPQRILEWAHSIGVVTDAGLAECVPPLPPLALRQITSEIEPVLFLFTGFHDLSTLLTLYHQHATAAPARPRVLDFGCGPGRMTRFLDPATCDICASDVNPDHVAWCRANLPAVDTRVNGFAPPLSFDDASFDFVYSLSIISHLSEKMLSAWLSELARVAKPGGIVILTFHGEPALRLIAESAPHQAMVQMTAQDAHEILDRLPSERVILLRYVEGVIDLAKVGTADYGTTFIDSGFAGEICAAHGLAPLAHVPAGLRAFQDVLVVRR